MAKEHDKSCRPETMEHETDNSTSPDVSAEPTSTDEEDCVIAKANRSIGEYSSFTWNNGG